MSGDPYIKENERLEAEINRLRAELEIARQSDTDYQAHIENAKLRIELKKEEQFTMALQIELKREEKFTMAAMDKAKVYQAALERLTQSADPWARGVAATALANERRALAKEGK